MSTTVHSLTLDHKTAPLTLREGLPSTLPNDLPIALLATCNRWELYAPTSIDPTTIRAWLTANGATKPSVSALQERTGHNAVHHLLRVAAGLESLILGEPQILGQTTTTHNTATHHNPTLTALFTLAIRTGKRVRTETAINRHPANVGTAALTHLPKPLKNLQITLIGAGEMAEITHRTLTKRGITPTVLNRTPANIHFETENRGGLDQLPHAITTSNAIISATAAPTPLITLSETTGLLAERHGKHLHLIDLAVPRDIDPALATHPLITLINMETLTDQVTASRQAREAEIPHAEQIIAQSMTEWEDLQRELTIRPTIKRLHQKADTIRERELARTLKHINVDDATKAHIAKLSQNLVRQLLHTPTAQLRADHELAPVVDDLFQLETPSRRDTMHRVPAEGEENK